MKCPRFRSCIYFSVTATVAFTGFICLPARAGSFIINEQSVSGLGAAYAGGAAQAEDASTIFFNPAGIAFLPQGEFQAGLHYIMPSGTISNNGSTINAPRTAFNGAKITGGNGGGDGVDQINLQTFFFPPRISGLHNSA